MIRVLSVAVSVVTLSWATSKAEDWIQRDFGTFSTHSDVDAVVQSDFRLKGSSFSKQGQPSDLSTVGFVTTKASDLFTNPNLQATEDYITGRFG